MLGNHRNNLLSRKAARRSGKMARSPAAQPGVAFDHVQGTGSQTFQIWTVGSGSYQFVWNVLSTPTGLKASAGNGQVALSWNSMASASGYNVKRSTTSGGGYVTVAGGVSGTNLTDMAVTNNTTYYYVVSAVSDGIESANSSEVNATPQWPPLSGIISNPGFETPSISTYEYNPSGEAGSSPPSPAPPVPASAPMAAPLPAAIRARRKASRWRFCKAPPRFHKR